MLTPKTQLNLRNAKSYFREHLSAGDYYAEGQKVTGEWFGLGAEKLGLSGVVTERDFLRLCEGLHPKTGGRLTQRLNASRQKAGHCVANRRVFYDFTISPPKSVSVVALLGDDRIVAVHEAAVRTAMTELERRAGARVRTGGASHSRTTGNVIGAAFRHETSRELDPHLHTHCVLLNATFDLVEQRWKALQAVELFRAQKLAEHAYYHELCKGLRRLGYAVEPNRRDFEIRGVPESVIARFSKRRAQIDAEAKRRLGSEKDTARLPAVRAQVAHDVRRRKSTDAFAANLRGHWQGQLTKPESEALRAVARSRAEPADAADPAALLAWADAHVFERRAVAAEHELLALALARGRGLDFDLADLRLALMARDYLRDGDSGTLTSREALRCELELVLAARDGRRNHAALAPDFRPSPRLAAEQERAVRQILTSRDFITLFRGGAGTGKSFALQEVHRGLVAADHPVVVVAPQRQQALDLQKDGLPADTLARLLTTRELPRGAVVLLDEAGQVGGRQLHDLVKLARAHDARLILSGDTRQHGAVAASDALCAIEAYGQLTPAEVTEIRRQDPNRARTRSARADIGRYRAAVKAASAGELDASFGILDRLGWVREEPERSRHEIVAREFRAATERGESALVVAQTWTEVDAVNRAIRAELARAGCLGPAANLTTYAAVDATLAQKRDPSFYTSGQSVHFVQRYGRFAKGDICQVVGTSPRGVVVLKNDRRSTVSFRYADRLALVEPRPLEIGAGDRLQLKFNGRSVEGAPFANGELVTIRAVAADGQITVVGDHGAEKTLSPAQRLFRLGYAITSYGSQGKTVDTVLLSDAGERAATSRNQWYVAISRARQRALIVTADKAGLRDHIRRDGARPLALDVAASARTASRPAEPRWVRRARAAIATLHRVRAVQAYHRPAVVVRRHV